MNRITIEISKGRIKEYEKLSVLTSTPEFLIPMEFIEYEDCYSVTYDTSGYLRMSEENSAITFRDAFDCIEGIIEAYRKAPQFLIFPDRFTLNDETVYFNKKERRVRILFLPPEEEIESTPSKQLIDFADLIKSLNVTRETSEYLEIFKEYVRESSGLRELQNRVLMIKREAKICGIE